MIQLDLFEPQFTFVEAKNIIHTPPLGIKFSKFVSRSRIYEILSAMSRGDITVFDNRGNELQVTI